jgi:hypothetical protein
VHVERTLAEIALRRISGGALVVDDPVLGASNALLVAEGFHLRGLLVVAAASLVTGPAVAIGRKRTQDPVLQSIRWPVADRGQGIATACILRQIADGGVGPEEGERHPSLGF